jgi:hypothetical protein
MTGRVIWLRSFTLKEGAPQVAPGSFEHPLPDGIMLKRVGQNGAGSGEVFVPHPV